MADVDTSVDARLPDAGELIDSLYMSEPNNGVNNLPENSFSKATGGKAKETIPGLVRNQQYDEEIVFEDSTKSVGPTSTSEKLAIEKTGEDEKGAVSCKIVSSSEAPTVGDSKGEDLSSTGIYKSSEKDRDTGNKVTSAADLAKTIQAGDQNEESNVIENVEESAVKAPDNKVDGDNGTKKDGLVAEAADISVNSVSATAVAASVHEASDSIPQEGAEPQVETMTSIVEIPAPTMQSKSSEIQLRSRRGSSGVNNAFQTPSAKQSVKTKAHTQPGSETIFKFLPDDDHVIIDDKSLSKKNDDVEKPDCGDITDPNDPLLGQQASFNLSTKSDSLKHLPWFARNISERETCCAITGFGMLATCCPCVILGMIHSKKTHEPMLCFQNTYCNTVASYCNLMGVCGNVYKNGICFGEHGMSECCKTSVFTACGYPCSPMLVNYLRIKKRKNETIYQLEKPPYSWWFRPLRECCLWPMLVQDEYRLVDRLERNGKAGILRCFRFRVRLL